MKNFLLFAYSFEYRRGGMKDFAGAYRTEKAAHKAAQQIIRATSGEIGYHIFHISTRRVISPVRWNGQADRLALRNWSSRNNSFLEK